MTRVKPDQLTAETADSVIRDDALWLTGPFLALDPQHEVLARLI